jgi:hypothetical protein
MNPSPSLVLARHSMETIFLRLPEAHGAGLGEPLSRKKGRRQDVEASTRKYGLQSFCDVRRTARKQRYT